MADFRYHKSIVDYLRVAVVPGQYEWTLVPASGWADIVGVLAGGRLACLAIRRPGGPSTGSQREFADRIRAMGARHEVVATVDDVRAVLARWRVETRDVRAEYGIATPGRGRAA